MENIPASDYVEQLKTNPKVQQWLSQFKYGNKDKFIEAYVELKYKFKSKPPREGVNESYRSNYIEVAESALEAILAKKIFDLELRWRAEEITIEGVAIGFDIGRWLHEPLNCPFAPDITEEDVEIMKAFLFLPDFESYKLIEHSDWYDNIMEALKNTGDKQHWFKFHNKHVSNPIPIDLPDIKGAKEDYYRKMHLKFNEEENAKKRTNITTSKYLSAEERLKLKSKLAEAAGLKDFVRFFKDMNYYYERENHVDTECAWNYLNIHYNDKIPIRANKNWAQALELAYQQHAARKAAEHLPFEVETYQLKKENNLIQEEGIHSYGCIAKKIREIILNAREKLGEPRNFDY